MTSIKDNLWVIAEAVCRWREYGGCLKQPTGTARIEVKHSSLCGTTEMWGPTHASCAPDNCPVVAAAECILDGAKK